MCVDRDSKRVVLTLQVKLEVYRKFHLRGWDRGWAATDTTPEAGTSQDFL